MSAPARLHPLTWLPPFLVGGAAAMAAEVALGLLLYSGDGFLRALTLILATLLGALALGLWSAPAPGPDEPVEGLRRRWLVVLLVYVAAAATAAGWTFLGGLTGGVLARGIGLALLAAAPLYATGALLGAMGAVRAGAGVRGPGSAAAAGAAVGAVCTGVLFARTLAPFTMHVFILVAVSGGALIHGRVLDRLLPTGAGADAYADADADADGDRGEDEEGPFPSGPGEPTT